MQLMIKPMSYMLKTQAHNADVKDFLNCISEAQKREDCSKLLDIFTKISGNQPKMWGTSIIGFGQYNYQGKSSTGSRMRTGFSPRKNGISIYIMPGYGMGMAKYLEKLGKHKVGKSCLNIKNLSDINLEILEKIIEKGWSKMNELYPEQ